MLVNRTSTGNCVVVIPGKDQDTCRADSHSLPSQNRTDTQRCTAGDRSHLSLKTTTKRPRYGTVIRKPARLTQSYSVADWGSGMSAGCTRVQLFAGTGNGWPHNAPQCH